MFPFVHGLNYMLQFADLQNYSRGSEYDAHEFLLYLLSAIEGDSR